MSDDRPEHASISCMLAYNEKTSRRCKYSALVNIKKLPSCLKCLRQIINQVYSSGPTNSVLRRCIPCSDWEFNADTSEFILNQSVLFAFFVFFQFSADVFYEILVGGCQVTFKQVR